MNTLQKIESLYQMVSIAPELRYSFIDNKIKVMPSKRLSDRFDIVKLLEDPNIGDVRALREECQRAEALFEESEKVYKYTRGYIGSHFRGLNRIEIHLPLNPNDWPSKRLKEGYCLISGRIGAFLIDGQEVTINRFKLDKKNRNELEDLCTREAIQKYFER